MNLASLAKDAAELLLGEPGLTQHCGVCWYLLAKQLLCSTAQAEEIVILASLAKDAAELLWEMVATEDLGDATQQMRGNASTIQVRPMVFP